MTYFFKPIGVLAIGTLALAACTNPDGTQRQKTNEGLAMGAAAGALVGLLVDGDKGALKGAVAGAAIGGLIGEDLQRQEDALRQSIGNSGATITNTGNELIVTLPEAITFATDSTYVRDSLRGDLVKLAQNLNDYPGSTVDVIGHTDSVGDANYNQNLSARRADSVSNILLTNGVSSSRMRSYGRGETSPVASNQTSTGRAQNRRVEVVIRPST